MGRVRKAGDEQPLHHNAVMAVSEEELYDCEGDLHALHAGIDRWRSVSPYFMVGGWLRQKVKSARRKLEEGRMQGRSEER